MKFLKLTALIGFALSSLAAFNANAQIGPAARSACVWSTLSTQRIAAQDRIEVTRACRIGTTIVARQIRNTRISTSAPFNGNVPTATGSRWKYACEMSSLALNYASTGCNVDGIVAAKSMTYPQGTSSATIPMCLWSVQSYGIGADRAQTTIKVCKVGTTTVATQTIKAGANVTSLNACALNVSNDYRASATTCTNPVIVRACDAGQNKFVRQTNPPLIYYPGVNDFFPDIRKATLPNNVCGASACPVSVYSYSRYELGYPGFVSPEVDWHITCL